MSTLPLSDLKAVGLPGERQRRVAIFATLSRLSPGEPPVSVGVVHLDALGASTRFWLFGTPWMRELQAKSMASLLPGENLVLGADLNTWHGAGEPATRFLAKAVGTRCRWFGMDEDSACSTICSSAPPATGPRSSKSPRATTDRITGR